MATKKEDTIRVLRVYEFTGPRSLVEAQVAKSIHGDKDVGNGVVIKGAIIGTYPEILSVPSPEPEPTPTGKPLMLTRGAGRIGYLALGIHRVDYSVTEVVAQAMLFDSEETALAAWRAASTELPGSLIRQLDGWRFLGYADDVATRDAKAVDNKKV